MANKKNIEKYQKVPPAKIRGFFSTSHLVNKRRLILVLTLGGLVILFPLLLFFIFFSNRLYPFVSVANVSLTARTEKDAQIILTNMLDEKLEQKITLKYQEGESNQSFTLIPQEVLRKIDTQAPIAEAYDYGHHKFFTAPVNISLSPEFNEGLDKKVAEINQIVRKEPVDAEIKIDGDQINVTPSQEGIEVDEKTLKNIINEYLNQKNSPTTFKLPLKSISPSLSYKSALNLKKTLDQVKIEPLKLKYQDKEWLLGLSEVINLIDIQNSKPSLASGEIGSTSFNIASVSLGNESLTDADIILGPNKIQDYLKSIAQEIDQPLREPLFSFDGTRVTEFQPPQTGRSLNIDKAALLITDNLLHPTQKVIELPVDVIEPKNKLSNEIGIKELIGGGASNFAGSIPNRIYNVSLAASRINGVLIPPDQEFSFVNTVGDITAATGYKQAYVIKSGRTVLDDGGGVCQVSTTLFRAVLNSGLPITKRVAHAYRVGYYEQGYPPGLDATIFYPSVDFKFKNDTGHYILIQTSVSGTSLAVNLYGTSDGRVADVSRPVITSTSPAPAELRQDDPTLPRGTVKQVDFSAAGATVVFNRKVTRGGETLISESFKSVYRPWQAVFLVGTGG